MGKEAMVKKYPKQIWAALREGYALTCTESLFAPTETDERNAPLEMHSGFSVFRFAIAASGNGSTVGNIKASEIPYLLEEYRFQRDILRRISLQTRSIAYTVPIRGRSFSNKPAAEVLYMPDGIKQLEDAKEFLERNLQKYPKNQKKIDAINEAFELYRTGQLKKPTSLPPLYSCLKYKTTQNEKKYNLCYTIEIVGNAGDKITWEFKIANFYAPLDPVKKIPLIEKAENRKVFSLSVDLMEMDNLLHRMDATIRLFEGSNFRTQYAIAKKYADVARENI